MAISSSLLKNFVEEMTKKEEQKQMNVAYGTLSDINGEKFVKLDGSNQFTPITEALGAENGDRVKVEIVNHKAIVTGNFTEPPSSRYATSYLKTIDGGFLVGNIDQNGKPIGKYLIIKNDGFLLLDEDANVIASFSDDTIVLGQNGNAEISFCNGNGSIRVNEDLGSIILNGIRGAGIRGNTNQYVMETVCASNSGSPQASIQVYKKDAPLKEKVSIVVDVNKGISLNTHDELPVVINGHEILDSSNSVVFGSLKTGRSIGNISEEITIRFDDMKIPEKYVLIGIRSLRTDDNYVSVAGYEFNSGRLKIILSKTIPGEMKYVTIYVEWVAIRSGGYTEMDEVIFDWAPPTK